MQTRQLDDKILATMLDMTVCALTAATKTVWPVANYGILRMEIWTLPDQNSVNNSTNKIFLKEIFENKLFFYPEELGWAKGPAVHGGSLWQYVYVPIH